MRLSTAVNPNVFAGSWVGPSTLTKTELINLQRDLIFGRKKRERNKDQNVFKECVNMLNDHAML